jgi:hypothetical protein
MIFYPHYQKLDDNLFTIHLPISKLNEMIQMYKVSFSVREKQYKIFNVRILSAKETGTLRFFKRLNESIRETKEGLLYSFDDTSIPSFSFSQCDYSEEYDLYKNDSQDIFLKVFDTYFIVEKYI